jgi:hypothetical protein
VTGNGYFGPTRASFMTWVADQVGMQEMGKAQAEAYLKSVYGTDFKLPEPPRQIAGGGIDSGQHIHLPTGFRWPKIGLGPWIFLSVLALLIGGWLLAGVFGGRLIQAPASSPPPQQGVQVPGGYQWDARPFNPFAQ